MFTRRYIAEFAASFTAYTALLVGSLEILKRPIAPFWRIPISLLPMLGAMGIVWVVVRQSRRIDELQRRVLFEAICLASIGTALATFSYGFLENVGFSHLSMFVVGRSWEYSWQ